MKDSKINVGIPIPATQAQAAAVRKNSNNSYTSNNSTSNSSSASSSRRNSRNKHSCCHKFNRRWPILLIFTSLIVFSLIVLFKWVGLDFLVDRQVAQQVRLLPNTDTWKKWVDIPIPIYLKFYFFNVTNPVEVMNGAKPNLQEVGPYIYEEKRTKNIVVFDKDQDTITYRQPITYYYRPELSHGPESDRIILINAPFVSVANQAKHVTNLSLAYGIIDRTLRQRGERLFMFNTVKEYLFDGFSVQSYINLLSNPILELLGRARIPEAFQGGKFGFFKGKNGSDDGEIIVRTGRTNPKEFGRFVSWNGRTKLDHWSGECNLINGTDGSILPPFISKTEILRFFIPDLCRSLLMIYESEMEYHGIKGYRFRLPDAKPVFAHPDFCFCPTNPKFTCFKQGVFSLAPCREGAPIGVSAPHFMEAYEPYLKAVNGLHPDMAKHDTYLDVEPKTGLVLRARKRLQFNIQVDQNPHMSTFSKVRDTLFPIMWVDEAADLEDSEELLGQIKAQLVDTIELVDRISLGGLITCSFLILVGILSCYLITCTGNPNKKRRNRSSGDDNSISSNSISTIDSNKTLTHQGTMTEHNPYHYFNPKLLPEDEKKVPFGGGKAKKEKISKL